MQSTYVILSDLHSMDPSFLELTLMAFDTTHIIHWDHVSVGNNQISRQNCNLGIEIDILRDVFVHHKIERVDIFWVRIFEHVWSNSILPGHVAATVWVFQFINFSFILFFLEKFKEEISVTNFDIDTGIFGGFFFIFIVAVFLSLHEIREKFNASIQPESHTYPEPSFSLGVVSGGWSEFVNWWLFFCLILDFLRVWSQTN